MFSAGFAICLCALISPSLQQEAGAPGQNSQAASGSKAPDTVTGLLDTTVKSTLDVGDMASRSIFEAIRLLFNVAGMTGNVAAKAAGSLANTAGTGVGRAVNTVTTLGSAGGNALSQTASELGKGGNEAFSQFSKTLETLSKPDTSSLSDFALNVGNKQKAAPAA